MFERAIAVPACPTRSIVHYFFILEIIDNTVNKKNKVSHTVTRTVVRPLKLTLELAEEMISRTPGLEGPKEYTQVSKP